MRIILSSFSLSLLLAAALTASVLVACSGAADDRSAPTVTPAPVVAATPIASPVPAPAATATPTASPSPTPAATPTPTASPTPAPTAATTPTASPTPAPTAAATPTASPTPAPTATPTATATATPAPTATPTPCPPAASLKPATSTPAVAATGTGLVSREDLGIREVDTAEALTAAGLRYVRCAAGETVRQKVGLYLLDVGTGAVEGWVLTSLEAPEAYDETGGFVSAGVSLSPGNRFLSFDRFQHDRVTGRTFEWDAPPLQRWGSLDDRRLLFRPADERGDRFVITDGTLQPVAQFAIPDGQEGQLEWLNFEYRSLVVRGQERDRGMRRYLHFFDLDKAAVGAFEPTATQVLPGDAETWSEGLYRLSSLGSSIELAIAGPDTCHVMHYGWDGTTLLDVSVPVVPLYGRRDCRISPDGHWMTAVTGMGATGAARGDPLIAVSILDTTTGDEVYRVKGVEGPGWWLDDSSGVSMSTSRGTRIVTLDGQWASEAPRPASVSAKPAPVIAKPAPTPTQPEYRIDHQKRVVTVRDHEGENLASLHFAEADTSRYGYPSISGSWGGTRDELRVRVSVYPGGRCGCGGDYVGPSPLAPVIESPPFEDQLQVEVVVDTCLRLRQEPSLRAAVLTCLLNGVIADTDDFSNDYNGAWMHVRTADGLEGWASADYLRWASDGVELEGERLHYSGGV